MVAGSHDITIEQGATFKLNIIWRDPAEAPINLTGYTARMQVRQRYASDDPLLNLTTENGGITLGGVAGTIAVVASAAATADISVRAGVYDLEVVSAGGEVTRLIQGCVTITPEVTR